MSTTATYCNVLVSPLDGTTLYPIEPVYPDQAQADALWEHLMAPDPEDFVPVERVSPFTPRDIDGAHWLLLSREQGSQGFEQIPDAQQYYQNWSLLPQTMRLVCDWPALYYSDAPRAETFEGREEGLAYLFSLVSRSHMVPQGKYQKYFLTLSTVYGAIMDAARSVLSEPANETERHHILHRLNQRIDGGIRLALEFGRAWNEESLAAATCEFKQAARNWVACQGAVFPVVRRAGDELKRAAERLGMHSSSTVVRDTVRTVIGSDYRVEGCLGQVTRWYARVPAYGSQSRCDEAFIVGMQSLIPDDREEVFPYAATVDPFFWTTLTDAFIFIGAPTAEQLKGCEQIIHDIRHMAFSLRVLNGNKRAELVLPVLLDAPTMIDFMAGAGLDGLNHFRTVCMYLMTDEVKPHLTALESSQYEEFLMGQTPLSTERWTIVRMMAMCLQSLHLALSAFSRRVRADAVARWTNVLVEDKYDQLADAVAVALDRATELEQELLPSGVQLKPAIAMAKFIPVTRAGMLKALDHCSPEEFMRERDSLPFVMSLFIDQVRVEAMLRMPGETPEIFECYLDRIIVIRRRLEVLARIQCVSEGPDGARFKEILESPEWIQMVVSTPGVNPLAVSAYNRFGSDLAKALIYTPDEGVEAIRNRIETALLVGCKSAGTGLYVPDLFCMNGLDALCPVHPLLSESIEKMVQICTAVNAVYSGVLVPLIYDGACQRKRPHVEVARLEEPAQKRVRFA